MTVPLLVTTITTVFLAELGDKTQLATVAISGSSKSPQAVFIGSASALVMSSLIGSVAGGSLSSLIPSEFLKLLAASGFLIIGIRLLWPIITNIIKRQQPN